MYNEKIRLYILARELDMEAKDLLDLCWKYGIDVKNQLTSIDAEVRDRLVAMVKRGSASASKPIQAAPSRELVKPIKNHDSVQSPTLQESPCPGPVPPLPQTLSTLSGSRSRYDPKKYPGIEHLLTFGEQAGLGKTFDCISLLAEIDAEAAVFKIRQFTERLCRKVVKATGRRTLDEMIKEIERDCLLGKKAMIYLRTLQNLGNQATHNTDDLFAEEFTDSDVNNAADSLACVLEAARKQNRLGSS